MADLPPGWTQHVAPSGHYYFYNKLTKESTYERPRLEIKPPAPPPPPEAANVEIISQDLGPDVGEQDSWMAAYAPDYERLQTQTQRKRRRRRKERAMLMRPLVAPWLFVVSNLGRPFFHNVADRSSVWIPPPDVQDAVEKIPRAEIVLMIARCRGLRGSKDGSRKLVRAAAAPVDDEMDDAALLGEIDATEKVYTTGIIKQRNRSDGEDYSDESEPESESDQDGNEFNEDDIEWQIQALMQDNPDFQLDEPDQEDVPYETRLEQFRQLLSQANPYSPWELEAPKLASDPRYVMLETTSERKAVFEDWAKQKVAELKLAAPAPKQSPEDEYKAFLREYATPKLYYQEFKRKYRKLPVFHESRLSDREREKMYREHVKLHSS